METKHAPTPWFYDPDFRRSHIHPKDVMKPYCAVCQQNVDPDKAVKVTVNEETWMAVEGHDKAELVHGASNRGISNHYIGRDCYSALAKACGEASDE